MTTDISHFTQIETQARAFIDNDLSPDLLRIWEMTGDIEKLIQHRMAFFTPDYSLLPDFLKSRISSYFKNQVINYAISNNYQFKGPFLTR